MSSEFPNQEWVHTALHLMTIGKNHAEEFEKHEDVAVELLESFDKTVAICETNCKPVAMARAQRAKEYLAGQFQMTKEAGIVMRLNLRAYIDAIENLLNQCGCPECQELKALLDSKYPVEKRPKSNGLPGERKHWAEPVRQHWETDVQGCRCPKCQARLAERSFGA